MILDCWFYKVNLDAKIYILLYISMNIYELLLD